MIPPRRCAATCLVSLLVTFAPSSREANRPSSTPPTWPLAWPLTWPPTWPLTWPPSARAEPAPPATGHRLLLVVDRPSDPLAERVRAELLSLGFIVDVAEPWRDPRPFEGLENAARASHAEAALRVLPGHNGVEVWMADQTSGRSLLRQSVVDERPGGPDEHLVALQTAELMRTSLLGRPSGPPPAPAGSGATNAGAGPPPAIPQGEPDAAVVAGTSQAVPHLLAYAGFGLLGSAGASGVALETWLGLAHAFGRGFYAGADVALPVRDIAIEGVEGRADLRVSVFEVTLGRTWANAGGRLVGGLALGGAALRVTSTGTANGTLLGASDARWTGALCARAEGAVAASAWLRLGLRLDTGLAVPALVVRFAGNEQARFGRPYVGMSLFAELLVP